MMLRRAAATASIAALVVPAGASAKAGDLVERAQAIALTTWIARSFAVAEHGTIDRRPNVVASADHRVYFGRASIPLESGRSMIVMVRIDRVSSTFSWKTALT